MTKDEFDSLFIALIVEPLGKLSFRAKGKSVYYDDGVTNVSLIRLGGRMSAPGSIAHILCFRHSMLPDLEGEAARSFISEIFAYPFKFQPSELLNTKPATWAYTPQNLRFDYERYSFQEKPTANVSAYLRAIAGLVGSDFLTWAKALSPSDAALQIRRRGEAGWCEELWLKAYGSG